jgi:hypothetical protein
LINGYCTIIASSGTVVTTGLALAGSSEDATVNNPLTVLQQVFVGNGLTVAIAETAVGKALDINVSTFNFRCYDLIANVLYLTITAEEKSQATTHSLPPQTQGNWILTSPQMMRQQLK